MDSVFIANSEGKPVLTVMMSCADEVNRGQEPIGEVELETFPSGAADLRFEKGVLIVEDLTGGTTAISALYRYRFDKAQHRMRLIGDDVMQNSRTNAHDSLKVSTNRLTGKSISQFRRLKNDEYVDQTPVTKKISAQVLYMEDAPKPCVALGCMDQ